MKINFATILGLGVAGFALYKMFGKGNQSTSEVEYISRAELDRRSGGTGEGAYTMDMVGVYKGTTNIAPQPMLTVDMDKESYTATAAAMEPEPAHEKAQGVLYNPLLGYQPSGTAPVTAPAAMQYTPAPEPSPVLVPVIGVTTIQTAQPVQTSYGSPAYNSTLNITTPAVPAVSPLPATYYRNGINYTIVYKADTSLLTAGEVQSAIENYISAYELGNGIKITPQDGLSFWIFKPRGGSAYASLAV